MQICFSQQSVYGMVGAILSEPPVVKSSRENENKFLNRLFGLLLNIFVIILGKMRLQNQMS
jgi:hypothetical protein